MSVVKQALSVDALVCKEKLKALNLLPIVANLMHSRNYRRWTWCQIVRAIEQYKTFLFISYLYPEIVLVPTREIDWVWHCHILHTRQYREDCETLFGRFIDHEPNLVGGSEANGQSWEAAFAQTQALLMLFEEYFWETALRKADVERIDRLLLAKESINPEKNEQYESCLSVFQSACGRPRGEKKTCSLQY